ncbi:sigma-70 family RNA polymerase sigma factor [Verrucomicrobiaceae bacterium N1E253]|uniref:Sigma-70 family RNA polymerase sigma factor n=1 Tax=Oceaniferula marina TaxID=2748318 RepID=A0A851GBK5_9BACT|nr:sigma-70 family RNA polymerase sigma factor [Oceaniferula marina]NWK54322.1 sigma-70 family RNA polymerase sigma factor [Oceaniferula marina]
MARERTTVDPDEDLVRRAKSGDTRAFDLLIMKYSRKLYGLIYHMTSHAEDSHDLLQDTFSKAYRSLKRFKGKSAFYTWIYAIAVNITLNHLKKSRKRAGPSYSDDQSGLLNDPAFIDQAYRANPRRNSNIHELHQRLNEALLKLSEGHRSVVMMFDIQGMPHAEISRILGVSEGTIRSRLFYAHKQLQGHLKEFDHRPGTGTSG